MLTAFPSLPILAEPESFSPIEKMLFLALAVASGWAFWLRFNFVIKRDVYKRQALRGKAKHHLKGPGHHVSTL